MYCPHCKSESTNVIDTNHDARGGVRRRRVCGACQKRFTTYERAVMTIPLLEKRDGTREEFSRDKLMAGIRLACTKRPISAETMERLVGEIEAELQQVGKPEISSRWIGDRVIRRLRELDGVAYIRYASVYLQLNTLESIRDEINRYFAQNPPAKPNTL